ncbi:MAG: hypothetical protein E4H13_07720 [Calditrichales bacterium]|nr:MAG: hypothetical protein E4H13_07720 [Calditrichales bacterium]
MDIKDKLKYYRQSAAEEVKAKQIDIHLVNLTELLHGTLIEKETLPVILIESYQAYTPDESEYLAQKKSNIFIPLLTKNQFTKPIPLSDILIFDLETTGLAGGTGTYPFLIGFGLFEAGGIRTRQYFLPDFGREISAYLDMRSMLKNTSVLLTYNGKSFDYPLIRNRMIMNRVDNPFEAHAHLDLLHPARRLWKNTLSSCSLDNIEEEIFLFGRWKDIDGALIPSAYFDFLQTGVSEKIELIISHNQQDIFSLARLLLYMDQTESGEYGYPRSVSEVSAILDLAVSTANFDKIASLMIEFTQRQRKVPASTLMAYSLLLKRHDQWPKAVGIWEVLLNRGEEILFSFEELAKYYEHRKKHHEKALEYTNRAIQYIDFINELKEDAKLDEYRQIFTHRLWRLNTKIESR